MKRILFLLLILMMASLFLVMVNTRPPKKLLSEIEPTIIRFPSEFANSKYAILVDYNKPVFRKRLWVIDLKTGKPVIHSHVSHAIKSGILYARQFSNVPGSKMSCCGVFTTSNTYTSQHGKNEYQIGMNIRGLDEGTNHHAFERRIVFHSGRQPFWSEGCFMTLKRINKRIIDMTKNGNLVIVSCCDSN